jgi:hypothetical protein
VGGRELAVWRRHLVDVDPGPRDCVMIELGDPSGYFLDLVVELLVCDQPVHVAVPFRARPVKIAGREQDLERARATDQAGESDQRPAVRDDIGPELRVAEQRVLTRREAQIAGEDELDSRAARTSAHLSDAYHRCTGQPHQQVGPGVQPTEVGTSDEGSGPATTQHRKTQGRMALGREADGDATEHESDEEHLEREREPVGRSAPARRQVVDPKPGRQCSRPCLRSPRGGLVGRRRSHPDR